MEHNEEGYFDGQGGEKLHYKIWRADDPKGIILLMHGVQSHSGRWRNAASVLVPKGYTLYGADFRGHGNSSGIRGHIDNFDEYISDSKKIYQIVNKNEKKDLPKFLLGHSMGAIVAIHYFAKYPEDFKGIILTGAGNKQNIPITGAINVILTLFSKISPKMSIRRTPKPERVTRDPEIWKQREEDPLVFETITLSFGRELYRALSRLEDLASRIESPSLIQKGEDDHVLVGAYKLHEKMASIDKTFKL